MSKLAALAVLAMAQPAAAQTVSPLECEAIRDYVAALETNVADLRSVIAQNARALGGMPGGAGEVTPSRISLAMTRALQDQDRATAERRRAGLALREICD